MSYSRHYNETISGTAYDTVNYPASENGGSMSVSVDWSESVGISVYVDTSSFDHSVSTIKHHIDGLTGAVVATEAAQIEEKVRGANAIGESVTTGFFRLIGSEITQQMVALKSRVDSLFLKLNDMKGACQRIQLNMQQDYHRITDRYTSIFEELDRELAMRVGSLDEAAYTLKREVSLEDRRSFDSTLSTVPTIFAGENSQAQSVLLASALRSRMNNLLQCAVAYLATEKRTSNAVSTMLEAGGREDSATASLPVAYMAVENRRILAHFHERSLSWRPLPSESKAQIERFLFPLIDAIHTPSQDQDARVRQMILQLWKAHAPESLAL